MASDHITMENDQVDGPGTSAALPRVKKTLGKSGTAVQEPKEADSNFAADDEYSFLAAGRDFESMNTTHLDVWFMMGLIGFCIGLIGFVLHQLIEKIAATKWTITQKYIEDGELPTACLFATGYSVLFILFSAGIVIYLRPCAGGSGIPEITGFLNGTNVRHIFNIKTMVVKFLSCVACVGCGLPVGPEGPMIHLGALIGAGVSQFRSETLGIKLPILEKFRTSESRRNFITAGAAAGVASAFGAPVGGLLFSMEEVSSFWSVTLSWQIFFCCIIATFTTDLFNSAFKDFNYTGSAAFTIVNLKIVRGRSTLLHKIQRDWVQKLCKLLEPCIIMILVTVFSILVPKAFACSKFTCIEGRNGDPTYGCYNDSRNHLHVDPEVVRYSCSQGKPYSISNTTFYTNSTYNEVASLLFGTLEDAVTFLFSRDTHLEFNYASLFSVLPFYFLAVLWACSTAVACGALVPMLMVGAVYGRIVGRLMVTLFGVHQAGYWEWMDPGAFALIGAASFFGDGADKRRAGVVACDGVCDGGQVGGGFLHSPHLPRPSRAQMLQLELYTAGDIMSHPVISVRCHELITTLSHLLLETSHGGFPIIKKGRDGEEHFYGLITRLELTVILMNEDLFVPAQDLEDSDTASLGSHDVNWIEFDQLNIHKLNNPEETSRVLNKYLDDPKYNNLCLDLMPYINQSAMSIQEKFSLKRMYVIFRTLGLRHLVVTNSRNIVKGIITRKDLMGFSIQERLTNKILSDHSLNGTVELHAVASSDNKCIKANNVQMYELFLYSLSQCIMKNFPAKHFMNIRDCKSEKCGTNVGKFSVSFLTLRKMTLFI
ncbi:CLCD-like protein, partial [Mya arenaria]